MRHLARVRIRVMVSVIVRVMVRVMVRSSIGQKVANCARAISKLRGAFCKLRDKSHAIIMAIIGRKRRASHRLLKCSMVE